MRQSGSRVARIAVGVLFAAVFLFACGGDEPSQPVSTSRAGAAPGDPTPLVALMRELDEPWFAAVEASGWLESKDLGEPARAKWVAQLGAAHARVKALLGDPRFAPPNAALEAVFHMMRDGLGATFASWDAEAKSGNPEAIRNARRAVEASCASCHRSMRDEDPAKLRVSMRRWETLFDHLRQHALRIEAEPGDLGRLALIGAAAAELGIMAESGTLQPLPGAPAEHQAQRTQFQGVAEALRAAAEKRDARAAFDAFGPVGISCASCHEARNVRLPE